MLPMLPTSLMILYVSDCPIIYFPKVDHTSLGNVSLTNVKIKKIKEELPKSLKSLNLFHCKDLVEFSSNIPVNVKWFNLTGCSNLKLNDEYLKNSYLITYTTSEGNVYKPKEKYSIFS
jgi:hypothetical protein